MAIAGAIVIIGLAVGIVSYPFFADLDPAANLATAFDHVAEPAVPPRVPYFAGTTTSNNMVANTLSCTAELGRCPSTRVSVWQKEPVGRRTICYCFGESEAGLRAEVEQTGGSKAPVARRAQRGGWPREVVALSSLPDVRRSRFDQPQQRVGVHHV